MRHFTEASIPPIYKNLHNTQAHLSFDMSNAPLAAAINATNLPCTAPRSRTLLLFTKTIGCG